MIRYEGVEDGEWLLIENKDHLREISAISRVADQVGFNKSKSKTSARIKVLGSHVRFQMAAGVVEFTDGSELLVRPKAAPTSSSWIDDLNFLYEFGKSGLSSFGPSSQLDYAQIDRLIEDFNRALLEANLRAPVKYVREFIHSFDIQDFDIQLLQDVTPSGFKQSVLARNPDTNVLKVIYYALWLSDQITQRDSIVRTPLEIQLSIEHVKAQFLVGSLEKLFDIAVEIINFVPQTEKLLISLPGSTSQIYATEIVWESFCRQLIAHALLEHVATSMFSVDSSATRFVIGSVDGRPISLYPDIVVRKSEEPFVLFDAKYKTLNLNKSFSPSSADLYEMSAFLDASATTTGVLMYPSYSDKFLAKILSTSDVTLGAEKSVIAIAVSAMGISKRLNALTDSVSSLCRNLSAFRNLGANNLLSDLSA